MDGSGANEGALKAAFMAYRARERKEAGVEDFTAEEVRPVFPPSSSTLTNSRADAPHSRRCRRS